MIPLLSSAVLPFVILAASAALPQQSSTSDVVRSLGGTRPANVPAAYVATPQGYFHPSCVVELKEDENLDSDDDIIAANGTRRPLKLCLLSHFLANGEEVSPLFGTPAIAHSYVADVETTSAGAMSWISANWTVPNNPPTASGQTLYFFPGLVPNSTNDTILQPVLGWNHFG